MQESFSSAPEVYIMKHIPPVKSVCEKYPASLDLALLLPPLPMATPTPMMMALAINRMIRLVMFRVNTSEVEDALANNSMALVSKACSTMMSKVLSNRPPLLKY